jgi:hypothetical protein
MTTLTVLIDNKSKRKYKLTNEKIEFQELRDRILRAEGLQALKTSAKVAMKTGLRKMTLKEIEKEILSARHGQARS